MEDVLRQLWWVCLLGLLCACGRQVPPAAPPAPAHTWQGVLAAVAPSGGYALLSVEELPVPTLPPSQLFVSDMLENYGAVRLHVAAWTSTTDRAAAALPVYVAEMPSPLHAYGLYNAAPAGADQTALRGGPAKRVSGTLVGMKGSCVFWTRSDSRSGPTWVAGERLFSCVCRALPGEWAPPAEVCSLGRMVPAPESIEFVKDNYLGAGVFGAALVARFSANGRPTEAFVLAPATHRAGDALLRGFRAWLANNGITGVQVEQGGTSTLFVRDAKIGELYLALDTHGLRGVHGAADVTTAKTLLEEWQQLEEE